MPLLAESPNKMWRHFYLPASENLRSVIKRNNLLALHTPWRHVKSTFDFVHLYFGERVCFLRDCDRLKQLYYPCVCFQYIEWLALLKISSTKCFFIQSWSRSIRNQGKELIFSNPSGWSITLGQNSFKGLIICIHNSNSSNTSVSFSCLVKFVVTIS